MVIKLIKKWAFQRKLRGEAKREEEELKNIENQINETKKLNSDVINDKIVNSRKQIKLLQLEKQKKDLMLNLGYPVEDEEEEDEETDDDEIKAMFDNLVFNALNKPKQEAKPSTQTLEETLSPIRSEEDFKTLPHSSTEKKKDNNLLEDLFDKVRAMPGPIQKMIIKKATEFI